MPGAGVEDTVEAGTDATVEAGTEATVELEVAVCFVSVTWMKASEGQWKTPPRRLL